MIANTLQQKIGEAMKARDAVRVSTLRMLSSALTYEKIEKQRELSNGEELTVIAREVKKRKEAVEFYKNANESSTSSGKNPNAKEKQDLEEKEIKILEEFLPEQMDDVQLNQLISNTINQLNAKGIADMGKVIGEVKSKVGATAEGSKIAEIVRSKLVE